MQIIFSVDNGTIHVRSFVHYSSTDSRSTLETSLELKVITMQIWSRSGRWKRRFTYPLFSYLYILYHHFTLIILKDVFLSFAATSMRPCRAVLTYNGIAF